MPYAAWGELLQHYLKEARDARSVGTTTEVVAEMLKSHADPPSLAEFGALLNPILATDLPPNSAEEKLKSKQKDQVRLSSRTFKFTRLISLAEFADHSRPATYTHPGPSFGGTCTVDHRRLPLHA
jgi:hypothetical protein